MEIVFIIPCDGGRHLSISYGGLGDTLSQPFGVGKCKQDAKREYCLTGAYLGVRDRKQTQARQSIAPRILLTLRRSLRMVKRRSCKQFKEGAALPTGVYIDVHEQGKT